MFERPRICAVFRFLLGFLSVGCFTLFVLCTRFAPSCDLVVTREFAEKCRGRRLVSVHAIMKVAIDTQANEQIAGVKLGACDIR